jgi:hypothetical protein
MHIRDHVKCLSEFFDVVVIREDCNYQQICDTYRPDLTLFESGPNLANCHRLKIINVHACPEIPKLGLLNADAWSETRAGTLSEMEHWGIGTFFSIAVTAAEHTPEIAENLYIWPNFIDPRIYRDYGQSKNIPVFFTGAQASQYPWRRAVYKLVLQRYPSLFSPHSGYYRDRSATAPMLHGEQYARTINASWFVPTCGTVAKEVVRKHFEIPACNACLITEKSPALEAAGFVDMVNCVFADEDDVLDKLDYLFGNTNKLERITHAGYQLVHSRHTLKQRDQILQWFNLYKNLKSDQKIIQSSPFEALSVVQKSIEAKHPHVISNGLHLKLLRQGDKMLWAGKYEEAEGMYLKCLSYTRMLPEPKFRLMLCNLYKGNAQLALSWVMAPIQYTLAGYKAVDPDPVEWAWFIICLLCVGKLDAAIKRAGQFIWLRHPELNRVRFVIDILKGRGGTGLLPEDGELKHRCSIHQLPSKSLNEWAEQVCIMLKACRQHGAAESLMNHFAREGTAAQLRQSNSEVKKGVLEKEKGDIGKTPDMEKHFGFGRKLNWHRLDDPIIYFRVRQKLEKLRRRLRDLSLHFRGFAKRRSAT